VKIVYSREMGRRYPTNPVENPDRVSLPAAMLEEFEFIEPIPADLKDIARVHGPEHINRVKASGLYDAAALAAGGAICAA
jgi:acetoin utilization deacetylase AcuC-like enzyme